MEFLSAPKLRAANQYNLSFCLGYVFYELLISRTIPELFCGSFSRSISRNDRDVVTENDGVPEVFAFSSVQALTEAMRMFGVGKGEDSMGVKRDSVDADVAQPIAEGAEGYSKVEI